MLVQTTGTMYDELQSLLLSLRSLTPELRYTKLRTYFIVCKKKLVQLLCVCKWLTIPSNVEYFSNLNSLRDQLSQIENLLNEAEYSLYCTHSHLFSRRVRSLNVEAAKDILARSSYPYIPIEVFTCGIEPISKYTNAEKDSMNKRLTTCIRAKLALYDSIPSEITNSNIIDGLLIIKQPHLYEAGITLKYAHEKAPWKVIGFRILSDISTNENVKVPRNLYDKETYENEVMKIICKNNTNKKDSIQNNDMVIDNDVDTDSDRMKLQDIHRICIHASLAVSLRLLYVLANVYAKTIKKDLLVDFNESDNGSTLKISFWKSPTTGNLLYELRITHCRIQSSSSSSSSSSLTPRQNTVGEGEIVANRFFVELWSRHEDNNKLEFKKINGIQDYINADDFVSNGSSLSLLLSNVLAILAECKLKILLARLLITPEVITAKCLGLNMELNKEKLGLIISFGSSSSSPSSEMIIGVDNQYGQFKVRYVNSISTLSNVDVFLKEMNNIESEDYNVRVQEEIGVNGIMQLGKSDIFIDSNISIKKNSLKPFITAEVMLFQLAINHWVHLLKREGELEPVAFNAAALLESNGLKPDGECLVFELSSGKSDEIMGEDLIANAMNIIPVAFMISKKRNRENDSSSSLLLKKLKPHEVIVSGPHNFLYLALVIDKSYAATLIALQCDRHCNPLYLPTVISSLTMKTLQFHNDYDNNHEIRQIINSVYEWNSRVGNEGAVRAYTVALLTIGPYNNDDVYFLSYFSDVSATVLIISRREAQVKAKFLLLQNPERKKDGLILISLATFEELIKNSKVLLDVMISLKRTSSLLVPVIQSINSCLNSHYDSVCHLHLHAYISEVKADSNGIFNAIIDGLHKGRLLVEFYGMILLASNSSTKCSANLIHYDNICDTNEISMVFAVIPKADTNSNKDVSNFIKVEAVFPNMTLLVDNNGEVSTIKSNDLKSIISNIFV